MTLLFDNAGPKLDYQHGILHVHDINPEIYTRWRMSRLEMLFFGIRCMAAAFFAR